MKERFKRNRKVFRGMIAGAVLMAGIWYASGFFNSHDELYEGYGLGYEDGYSVGYNDGFRQEDPKPLSSLIDHFMTQEDYQTRDLIGGRAIGE